MDSGPAAISDRPTTLAFVTLTDGHASYAFYDENTAGRMLSPDDLPDVTPQTLFVGGISLAVEPCAASLRGVGGPAIRKSRRRHDGPERATQSFIADAAAFRARGSARMLGITAIS